MSLARCFCRSFATLSLFTPQLMYESLTFINSSFNRLGTTLMVGTVLCMLAVTFGLLVVLLDRHGARVIGRRPPKKKEINLFDALRFPLSFWLVVLQCSLLYAVIVSISANGPLFIVSKYRLSVDMASIANSLSYASTVFITPFIALSIDYSGYNLVWGLVGIGFAIALHRIWTQLICTFHSCNTFVLFIFFFRHSNVGDTWVDCREAQSHYSLWCNNVGCCFISSSDQCDQWCDY